MVELPDNFRETLRDFTRDLTATFPEYSALWSQWTEPDADVAAVFQHCLAVYPERFFDILNQNADIFDASNPTNTHFLPGVEFKMLYHCEGITDKTRESMWKYLQVVLFLLVGNIKDKADFGPSLNLFDNEDDLQEKLQEVMKNLGGFFGTKGEDGDEEEEEEEDKDDPFRPAAGSLPNFKPDQLHKHLMELFSGKIGKLAKELAEDLGDDFAATLGEDMKDVTSTQEVLAKLMKDPSKVSGLVKTVGEKLNQKMAAGDISREDIMKEASEMMKKMKEMGGQDFLKTFAKGMGLPKGAKVDPNAFKQFEKKLSMREKMAAKAQQRQERKLAEQAAEMAKRQQQLEQHRQQLAAKQVTETMSVDDIMETLGLKDAEPKKPKKKRATQK